MFLVWYVELHEIKHAPCRLEGWTVRGEFQSKASIFLFRILVDAIGSNSCTDNPLLSVRKLDRTKAWVNAGQDVCGGFLNCVEIGMLS